MRNVESTIQMMRALSLSANADALIQVFAHHVRDTTCLNRALMVDRLDLTAPQYRVVRCGHWDAQQGRFIESQPNDIRQGGLLAQLLYAGELNLIEDLSISPGDPASDLLCGQKSLMAFPVFDRGVATGSLVLLGSEPQTSSQSELCGLAMMAGLLDRAIQTHALVRQVEATCQELDHELAAAADVQRWLLPSSLPALPGVSIATSYRTAEQSGGDYYDAMELPDGRLGLLIADVSGHGAPAAVLVAVVRTIVHLRQSLWDNPASLLQEINSSLCELNLSEHCFFVTAFCAVLDPSGGRLVYSSAGHPPPRLVRADDERLIALEEARSLPLGMQTNTRYTEAAISLSPRETLVLYTDGIVEARSAAGEQFGSERLDQVLRGLAPANTAQGTIRAALRAVEKFSGSAPRSDDQTLVSIKLNGKGS